MTIYILDTNHLSLYGRNYPTLIAVMLLSVFNILRYDLKSDGIYQSLKVQRICIGTQDLGIAFITLANNAVLLTRNLQDFNKVPELMIQDWTI